jgi:hypothetical protein
MDISNEKLLALKQHLTQQFEDLAASRRLKGAVEIMLDQAMAMPDSNIEEIHDMSLVEIGNRFGRPIGSSAMIGVGLVYGLLSDPEELGRELGAQNV